MPALPESRNNSQMVWDGITDDDTDISPPGVTGSYFLDNVRLLVQGECGRRLGFGSQIADSGIVCAELGAYIIFITAAGNIQSDLQ